MDTGNTFSFLGMLGVAGTSFFSAWAAFRYVILGSYRLNSDVSKRLIDKLEKEARTWILTGEHVEPPKYPNVYETLALIKGIPLFFSRNERLMTAGWQGKDEVSSVTFLRWHRSKVLDLLSGVKSDSRFVSVSALSPGGGDRLGELSHVPNPELYLNKGTYEDIEEDVKRVVAGEVNKTSFLLHGPPGNGKTQFVKYIARKYSLPVYVVYLNPDYNNLDVARMFAEIPRHCLVLLEDFDNYFDGRECIMKNEQVRFTFDSIINALDGVHNDYQGVVFAMTANDIERIDYSLKSRPSRFKFVREFGMPDAETRERILGSTDLVESTAGMSLDAVFSKKSNDR